MARIGRPVQAHLRSDATTAPGFVVRHVLDYARCGTAAMSGEDGATRTHMHSKHADVVGVVRGAGKPRPQRQVAAGARLLLCASLRAGYHAGLTSPSSPSGSARNPAAPSSYLHRTLPVAAFVRMRSTRTDTGRVQIQSHVQALLSQERVASSHGAVAGLPRFNKRGYTGRCL